MALQSGFAKAAALVNGPHAHHELTILPIGIPHTVAGGPLLPAGSLVPVGDLLRPGYLWALDGRELVEKPPAANAAPGGIGGKAGSAPVREGSRRLRGKPARPDRIGRAGWRGVIISVDRRVLTSSIGKAVSSELVDLSLRDMGVLKHCAFPRDRDVLIILVARTVLLLISGGVYRRGGRDVRRAEREEFLPPSTRMMTGRGARIRSWRHHIPTRASRAKQAQPAHSTSRGAPAPSSRDKPHRNRPQLGIHTTAGTE